MISEAKVRGFVKGAKVVYRVDGSVKMIETENYTYYENSDSLYVEGVKIYDKIRVPNLSNITNIKITNSRKANFATIPFELKKFAPPLKFLLLLNDSN